MTEPERYDRQLRLWGAHGQRKLSQASICCFGSSAVACEVLKNLILPGIGSFVIVDDAKLTERDFGQNFFVPPTASLGEFRGRVVLETLLQLNPTVKGCFVQDVSDLDDEKFDVCIVSNFSMTQRIERIFNACKYMVKLNSIGFIGRIACSMNQPHLILEAKSEEGRIEDFRLTNPWPELLAFANQSFTDDLYHVPYFVILIKAAEIAKTHCRADLVQAIKSMAPVGMFEELENFQQAVANTYRITALVGDDQIVSDLKSMTTRPNLDNNFVTAIDAVIKFYEKNKCLPLFGSSLPDMASSSDMYTRLCGIYKEKALEDFYQVSNTDNEFVKLVIGNIRNIRVLTESAEDDLLDEEQKEIVEFFDSGKIGNLLGKEIERYEKGCELHSVSSVIGAVGAQEIVKLLTNQFTPIGKSFVFNGINGTAFMTG